MAGALKARALGQCRRGDGDFEQKQLIWKELWVPDRSVSSAEFMWPEVGDSDNCKTNNLIKRRILGSGEKRQLTVLVTKSMA